MNIPSLFLMKSKSWLLNFGLIPIALIFSISNAQAVTKLSDSPSLSVPGNVALALSVEWPTALGSAYLKLDASNNRLDPDDTYSETTDYLGYFDPKKCYDYHTEASTAKHYFDPVSVAATNHDCTGHWSGNFLNWALTQTIDPLRWALTGGYRSVDEASLTVLEKAWASNQGDYMTVNKTISGSGMVSRATPYNWADFKITAKHLGNQFIFSRLDDSSASTYYARVRVCKTGFTGSLESNCKQYGSNYKPEGLIQKNAMKLRFSAFGYLNNIASGTGDSSRDGGVLRAKMASLGPLKPDPGKADVTNANYEWDSATGVFLQNPDSTEATASGVSNSGVINYLNKFGSISGWYKSYDPVSELYYSALRYYKNQGNYSTYTNMTGSATDIANMKDGFPVITNWDDPIKYSCQKNFIIGVGDTNAWEDGNLPGSTLTSAGSTPPVDTTIDVKTATDRVGDLQGITSLGSTYQGAGRRNTFYIAGLAYDAHTKDFRTDFTGDQTASTYWLDVLESPTVNCMVTPLPTNCSVQNQYMLAAKYGGFDVPAGYTPYSGTPTWTAANNSSWDENKDGLPDTYFKANDPKLMKDSLEEAFNNIISKLGKSSSSFVVSSPNIATSNMSFGATFDASSWTGNVRGNNITFSGGLPVETLAWNAVDKLELQNWNTGRYIATASCTSGTNGMKSCTGKPFRLASLSSTDQAFLGSTTTDQQNVLNFLRGDGSNEIDAGGTDMYRNRVKKLGDIVGSKVVAVGAPRAPYSDTYNPGYSSFQSTYASRTPLVYVGANDGMLHAFQGTPSGGNELFAYIPHALFAGPSNPATPNIDGLAALSSKTFLHHYYVNTTPRVADVNFGGGSSDWHTLLVGGLGKGGKAYYALDVSNPASLSNETNLATAVKWEFTHTDLGYSFDQPLIVKTAKYGWVVIVTSGYNNTDGQGYFFVIKASDGSLLEKVATGAGSITNDAGLAHATAFVPDYRDGTADAVYAGDLLGNVWRLDLTGSSTYSVDKIAYLTTSGSQPQPITVTPIVEYDQSTSKRYVFVGTGRMLDDTDFLDTQQQTFYAINDGTRSNFFDTATLPSGVSFPITRSNLDNNTSTAAADGIGTGGANKVGWFVDLGFGTAGYAYRIDNDMASNAGVIAFFTNAPDGDVCTASGTHQLYAMAYGTGKSLLYDGTTPSAVIIKHTSHTAGLGTNVSMYKGGSTGGSGVNLRACNDGGICLDHNLGGADSTGFKQLNWRELPTAE